jgi:hypothetical protein
MYVSISQDICHYLWQPFVLFIEKTVLAGTKENILHMHDFFSYMGQDEFLFHYLVRLLGAVQLDLDFQLEGFCRARDFYSTRQD